MIMFFPLLVTLFRPKSLSVKTGNLIPCVSRFSPAAQSLVEADTIWSCTCPKIGEFTPNENRCSRTSLAPLPKRILEAQLGSQITLQNGTGRTLRKHLRPFMHWHIPKDGTELSLALDISLGALSVTYFVCVLVVYVIAPAKFTAWHEWIANRGIAFGGNVSKFLSAFFLDTPYCLSALLTIHNF